MFLFIDHSSSNIRAGDLAASKFPNGIKWDYQTIHSLFSKMFEDMVDGPIPGSVFQTPYFFSRKNPFEYIDYIEIKGTIQRIWNQLTFTNIPYTSVQNYHYLWLKYNNLVSGDFAIYCLPIVREVFNRKTDYFMTFSQFLP